MLRRSTDGTIRQRDWAISGVLGGSGATFLTLGLTLTSEPASQRHTAVGLGIVLLAPAIGRLVVIKVLGAINGNGSSSSSNGPASALLAHPAHAHPVTIAPPEPPPAYTPLPAPKR